MNGGAAIIKMDDVTGCFFGFLIPYRDLQFELVATGKTKSPFAGGKRTFQNCWLYLIFLH